MRVGLRGAVCLTIITCVLFMLNARQAPIELFPSEEERASFMREAGAKESTRVLLLVTSWCGACRALEDSLAQAQVPFARFDIERSNAGARLFERAVEAGSSRAIPKVIVGRFLVDRRDAFAEAPLTETPAPGR